MELLVATRNKKKLEEIKHLLTDMDLCVTSLDDYADMPEIVEDGETFEENAIKKAVSIALFTKKLVLGEDSGLEVEALKGRPGVYSARYSGSGATDKKNNRKLLKELDGVPLKRRGACYQCAIALADGKRLIATVKGSCRGMIASAPRGDNGFGYDPLFLIPRLKKTFGELPIEVKHKMSHRRRAIQKARVLIQQYLIQSS